MSFPNGQNYYAILGARKTASQEEIERLYKHLAKQHHPDRGGNADEMKAINAAYRVLGNAETRRLYDSQSPVSDDALPPVVPPLSPPAALLPDTVSGRLIGASLLLLAGLTFLFLVRIYFIRFMWPILLAAVLVVILGVRKLHAAMVFARQSLAPSHCLRRYVWVQELGFWFIVCSSAYGIYLLMSSI
ncbi:MAG TPA: J domain-containing protein [Pyrinomonadaceae bacterium]|nr:J domain-containing protein [Pyrinomonadaceae bacterium]